MSSENAQDPQVTPAREEPKTAAEGASAPTAAPAAPPAAASTGRASTSSTAEPASAAAPAVEATGESAQAVAAPAPEAASKAPAPEAASKADNTTVADKAAAGTAATSATNPAEPGAEPNPAEPGAESNAAEAGAPPERKRRRRRRRRKRKAPADAAGDGAAAGDSAVAVSGAAQAEAKAAKAGLYSLTLKAGHVLPVWAGHPWVFAQAVQRVDKGAQPGDEVVVIDPQGKVLGRGLYSPKSAIVARLFGSRGSQPIDGTLLRERITQAVRRRQALQLPYTIVGHETDGYRLIHGEGDGMPGLIVDVFGDVLVLQLGTIGLVRLRDELVAALVEVIGPRAIIDRTPAGVAHTEGFPVPKDGSRILHGELPAQLAFRERGLRYELPMSLGQKTGFYFDQRPLRERIEALSRGSRVLDGCCYVGAVALSAARGGASEVVAVDKSAKAIEAAKHIAELNGYSEKIKFVQGEVQATFEQAQKDGGYDIVVCDPPKLAPQRRARHNAMGAYRRMASGACKATKPGGVVVVCSCSAAVSMEELQRALALGARDAGSRAVVFDRCFQGPDHAVVAAFPEGLYLKVLLARVEPV